MTNEKIKVMRLMVTKLIRMDKWGGAHTEIRNLTKGLPQHFTSSKKGKKIIQKAIKELIRKEFLIIKPSTRELHVSLNPRKMRKIKQFYEKRKD